MITENFSEWLHRQGYRVIETDSGLWYNIGPRVYQAFPYHVLIHPSESEINRFLCDNRAIALRYSTSIESRVGTISYHVVLEDPDYRLEVLSRKARYDVRKGLKNSVIRPVSMARMADEGWLLRLQTLRRQGRSEAESLGWWKRMCIEAQDLSGFEAWAAFVNDRMAAALISFTCGDTCSILYQQSLDEYLASGVNNALIFQFSKEVLSRPDITRIFYGLQSLDAPVSVDQFKFRMCYLAKPIRQRVVFHPVVAPLVGRITHAVIRGVLHLRIGASVVSKIEGMVRFYL